MTEAELKVQMIMKSELETAVKLLDKSLTEKTEFISHLRDQLEQVKKINLDLVNQNQVQYTLI